MIANASSTQCYTTSWHTYSTGCYSKHGSDFINVPIQPVWQWIMESDSRWLVFKATFNMSITSHMHVIYSIAHSICKLMGKLNTLAILRPLHSYTPYHSNGLMQGRCNSSAFVATDLCLFWIKSPPPSAAYMRLWIGSALLQIMACRLFGAKPLFEPMLEYC